MDAGAEEEGGEFEKADEENILEVLEALDEELGGKLDGKKGM